MINWEESAYKPILGEKDNPFDYFNQQDEYLGYEAQKSTNPEAAKALVQKMSEFSESAMCAGWVEGTEWTLWQVSLVKFNSWGNHAFSQEEVEELVSLSERCNGWWIWWDGERFVTKQQWQQIVVAWEI